MREWPMKGKTNRTHRALRPNITEPPSQCWQPSTSELPFCVEGMTIYLSTVIGSLLLAAKSILTKTCQKNDYYLFLEKKLALRSRDTKVWDRSMFQDHTELSREHKGTNLYYIWNNEMSRKQMPRACQGLNGSVTESSQPHPLPATNESLSYFRKAHLKSRVSL